MIGAGKRRVRAAAVLAALAVVLLAAAPAGAAKPPPIKHVFVIVLENKNYAATFGPAAEAPYLAHRLAPKGALLTQYHGTGHFSLGNYITMVSGQSENPLTQADCQSYTDFVSLGTAPGDQVLGAGCVYPASVSTIADQLDAAGLRWRGYMQDMGDDPTRESETCGHPAIGAQDMTQKATPLDQYATRHNPFMYFHSIIDDQGRCDRNVVGLDRLRHDLRKAKWTRNYSFITPDLCADGHDETCADPSQPGGYEGIDGFLRSWAPRILAAPAMRTGLLIVTFDESESGAEACCFVPSGPNTLQQGVSGPGGGRTGAVLISPQIKPGTITDHPYNHYSARDAVAPFGHDVFTAR